MSTITATESAQISAVAQSLFAAMQRTDAAFEAMKTAAQEVEAAATESETESLPSLIYRSQFSVLVPALQTYAATVVGIAQTLVTEVAELTMQSGYDCATWFYSAWAAVHYSEFPELPEEYEIEPDYWFEPLEAIAIPVASQLPLSAPQGFVTFGLLSPAPKTKCNRAKSPVQSTPAPAKGKRGRKPKAA
jgi:hypothetical protein